MVFFCFAEQGVRIEGVETPVSTMEPNCHSVSSLLILLFFKNNRAVRPKNICPIMKQRVFLRGITMYLIVA